MLALFSRFNSNLLEKTSDAVIKAGKTGDLGLVSFILLLILLSNLNRISMLLSLVMAKFMI